MDISEQAAPKAEKAKAKRAPRKKPAVVAAAETETPQSLHRKKLAAEREERKASVKVKEQWFERDNKKILQKTRMTNGNVHTAFICMDNAKNKEKIAALKIPTPSKAL